MTKLFLNPSSKRSISFGAAFPNLKFISNLNSSNNLFKLPPTKSKDFDSKLLNYIDNLDYGCKYLIQFSIPVFIQKDEYHRHKDDYYLSDLKEIACNLIILNDKNLNLDLKYIKHCIHDKISELIAEQYDPFESEDCLNQMKDYSYDKFIYLNIILIDKNHDYTFPNDNLIISSNFNIKRSFSTSSINNVINHNDFLNNHRRKFIISTFSISNQFNPVVYASITGLDDNFDLKSLSQRRDIVSWNSVIIISKFNHGYSEYKAKDLSLVFNNKIKVLFYNLTLDELFIIIKNNKDNTDIVKEIINSGLFLFEGYDWNEIVEVFLENGIFLTGGLGTKRHIISPTQFRLMNVLMFLNFNYSVLSYYYNHVNYLTNKGNLLKDKINIPNGKRSYSTLSKNSDFQKKYLSSNIKSDFKKKEFLFDYSPVYIGVENILKTNISSFEKQEKIEKLLNESWFELYLDDLKSSEHNKEYVRLLSNHIKSFSDALSIKLDNMKDKNLKHLEPLLNLPINVTSLLVFKILFPILFTGEEINKTTLIIKIGKNIFNKWVKLNYSNIKSVSSNINDFSSYKEKLNFTEKDFLNIGDFLFNILSDNNPIFNINIDQSDPLNTKLIVCPETKVREMFEKKIEIIGFKIPMITPPIRWGINTFGGYLHNKTEFDPLIKPSRKSALRTKISGRKKDIVFNTVNYMSQIPYCINKDVFNFIIENYNSLELKSTIHPLTSKYYSITSLKLKSEIENHNSLFYLQKNIIGLAKLLINVNEFYFPIELDWRGRVYCQSSYISFQGNELAKSLILFKNGKTLCNNGLYYLKIYGANLYGIDKESIISRIKWIDSNHQNIIDMNLDFILKASEPLIFIAFCFEYRNYFNNPKDFVSRLPILLDATCSGLQHLSAMVGESTIAKNVNLLESDPNMKPHDFYQFCIDLINKKIKDFTEENPLYIRLSKLNLTRSVIKQSIMTIPYNVTKRGILMQLEEYFEWIKIDGNNLLKPKWNNDPVFINKKELYQLAKIIHETLYEEHPRLKELVNYLNKITELLYDLNLPIIWKTPSGLVIRQKYTKFKKIRVKPSLNKTSTTYTILIPTDQIDLNKQRAAFMPNICHSMDASNISLMINTLIKQNKYINLFTVHDCFASTADSIQTINIVVRIAFLMLYSDSNYLNKLHDSYCKFITDNEFTIENNKVIDSSDKEFDIPIPPICNDLNLRNQINKAIYFIN